MHEVPIEDSLDLHAFAPQDVVDVVQEYVRAAHAAGFREVRLIHGRGRGVQRGMVQRALDEHALVEEFWDDPRSHLGATVVRLNRGEEIRGLTRSGGTRSGGSGGQEEIGSTAAPPGAPQSFSFKLLPYLNPSPLPLTSAFNIQPSALQVLLKRLLARRASGRASGTRDRPRPSPASAPRTPHARAARHRR
jgi:hypothetical protein